MSKHILILNQFTHMLVDPNHEKYRRFGGKQICKIKLNYILLFCINIDSNSNLVNTFFIIFDIIFLPKRTIC